MVRFRTTLRACLALASLLVISLSIFSPVAAQEATETPKAPQHTLTLSYESTPTAEPTLEAGIFRLTSSGDLSGDLSGTITQNVTQLCGCVTNNPLSPIDNIFTIETPDGMLKGYIVGYFYVPSEDSDHADYVGHGQVLSVSGTYADLYLADVYLNSEVALVDGNGVSDAGTITIVPR